MTRWTSTPLWNLSEDFVSYGQCLPAVHRSDRESALLGDGRIRSCGLRRSWLVMVDDIGANPRRVRRRDAGARRQDLFAALDLNGALDPNGSAND